MQDPTIAAAASAFPQLKAPQFPEQEQLKCPRCESTNTKFCYYNNYNLSQPRHFCKNCRRYWTKGGALRNIPVGGGSRKNTKRSSKQRSCSSLPQTPMTNTTPSLGPGLDSGLSPAPEHKPVPMLTSEIGTGLGLPAPAGGVGSFTSLLGLASGGGEGPFGNLFLDGLSQSGLRLGHDSGPGQNPGLKLMQESRGGSATSEGLIMGIGSGSGSDHHHQMQSCWGAASNNGWPDLAIYTPGSKFH